jgi:hypothetical protein
MLEVPVAADSLRKAYSKNFFRCSVEVLGENGGSVQLADRI